MWSKYLARSSSRLSIVFTVSLLASVYSFNTAEAETVSPAAERLKVLFLGDDREHRPTERLRDIARPMLDRGIELNYTGDLNDLNRENLDRYDALLLYADHPELSSEQEEALLSFVAGGGGFVPVHAASKSFSNSARYIELLGGKYQSHEDAEVQTSIEASDHEIMQGYAGFESTDRAIVHQDHNPDNRTVLSTRDDEPHTWIRTHEEGRVFYTAWGYGEETWSHPGFHDLLERGIRWAAGQDVQAALESRVIGNPFTYVVLDVPFPPPHQARLEYERTEGPMDRGSNYPLWYRKQEPLSAETAIERMIVPPGFRVELFAAEPDIVNPIYMNWDERGRLWVIESVEYPYPRDFWPDGGGKDRILVLEDTNGNGRADSFTVFAEDLNIPTSLVFSDGGVIVHQAPETLFLKDTTGDGKADVRKVLFEGWRQWDTHAGPNNLHYGLDNWIWGVLGYAGMNGTIGDKHHEFGMGVYRFQKDGSTLEFLRRTNNNTWGLGFNEQGGAFISTANGNPSTYLPFARRLYDNLQDMDDSVTERLTDTARIIMLTNLFRQVDWVGAFTSAAGHGLYTARTYPQEYWNRIAFVTDPTGQMVAELILEEKGSTYQATHPRNLIASDDEWFSPVMAEVGPDGHVWIADWYNYIIQHNAESDRQRPTPGNAYANPLRDRQHGRVYRLVYEGAQATEQDSLAAASPQEWVQMLGHDNMLWRKHAQRLLVERGDPDVAPALIERVNDQSVDEIGLNVAAIHALWTLHGLGELDRADGAAYAAALNALQHPSAGVRRNAVQVLPPASTSVEAILEKDLLNDEDAQVRLETLVALADLPASHEAGAAIFNLLNDSANREDRWIREAGALSAAVHSRGFLSTAAAGGMLPDVDSPDVDNGMAVLVRMVMNEDPDVIGELVETGETDELPPGIDAKIEIGTIVNTMEFDKEEVRVTAGQRIILTFNNTDNMEHNLLVIQPGTLAEIGRLADEMLTDPQARENHYVPDSEHVLAYTPILEPNESYELTFTVPSEPGEYVLVCTIPGHWRIMNSLLIVEPAE
ncbi:MAG: PVC-type heme-binding CxxCH protein [Opitutales bacterium]